MLPKLRLPWEKKVEEERPTPETYKTRLFEFLTSPPSMEREIDTMKLDKYYRVVAAVNYPRVVEAGWLTRLVEMNLDFDLSIHIVPYSVEAAVSMLETELKKQKTDILALESEGKIVPQALIQKHEDTKAMLQAIQAGRERMFDISLYACSKAHDKKELDKITSIIKANMAALLIAPKVPAFRMYDAVKSTLPICDDRLKVTRNICSSAVAACFPFVTASLERPRGVLVGFNRINDVPVIVDIWEMLNPNVLVLGTSGGGKSYCIKLLLMRQYLEGVDITVIDPQAEYSELVKTFDGQVVRIAPDSETMINPLDLLGQSYEEKKLSLFAFFRVLLGELTEAQRAILDECLDATYEDAGILKDDPRTWSKTPPTIRDLYEHVLPLTRSEKFIVQRPAMALATRLKPFAEGGLSFFNRPTKLELEKRIISFDIRDMPDVVKGAVMYLLLEYVYNLMKKSRRRRILVIDEAWTVMAAGEEAEYVMRIVKTCRKFNLSLVLITQDVEDVITTRAGRAVLYNTGTKLLFKQDPAVAEEVAKLFHLTESEAKLIRTARVGDAIMIAGNLKVPIYIRASPEEHRLITTKPEELVELREVVRGPEVERETGLLFDPSKPFHRSSLLAEDQIEALHKLGFHDYRTENLEGIPEIFLIRNETDENDEHFVLLNLLVEELQCYTSRISVHREKLPDLTFETPAGDIVAVEVVTDPKLEVAAEKVEEKLPILKKYSDYLIVTTNLDVAERFDKVVLKSQAAPRLKQYFRVAGAQAFRSSPNQMST